MLVLCRLTLACAGLLLLPVRLPRAEDIKAPIRGLVSMGADRLVDYGGDMSKRFSSASAAISRPAKSRGSTNCSATWTRSWRAG
jgi:hypothetical protein